MNNDTKTMSSIRKNVSNILNKYIGAPTPICIQQVKQEVYNTLQNLVHQSVIGQFNVNVQTDINDPSLMQVDVNISPVFPLTYYNIQMSKYNILSQENNNTHIWETVGEIGTMTENVCRICRMKTETYSNNNEEPIVYAKDDLNCNDYILREVLQ